MDLDITLSLDGTAQDAWLLLEPVMRAARHYGTQMNLPLVQAGDAKRKYDRLSAWVKQIKQQTGLHEAAIEP